LLRVGFA